MSDNDTLKAERWVAAAAAELINEWHNPFGVGLVSADVALLIKYVEQLEAAIDKAVTELDEFHFRLDGDKGCFTCFPGEDSWPCETAMIVDDLRNLILG